MPSHDPMKQKRWAKDHYARNKDHIKARSRAWTNRNRKRLATISVRAKDRPCAACGGTFAPWQMQFDHVRGEKKANVADMVSQAGVNVATLRAEIAKCEIVCANCHADRTHHRRLAAGKMTLEEEVVTEGHDQLELGVL